MSSQIMHVCELGVPSRIGRVDITLMSPQEIKDLSVANIIEPIAHEKNKPKKHGPNDHRLGPGERRIRCGTCGRKFGECSQHHGHVELWYPVYHIQYISTVLKILKNTCYWCGRVLVDENDPKVKNALKNLKKDERLDAIAALTKTKTVCHRLECKGIQPVYTKPKAAIDIEIDWSHAVFTDPNDALVKNKKFDAREVLNIFQHVPDCDWILQGFDPKLSNPTWTIIVNLSVCPPIVRPSITETEGSRTRGQDDITNKYKTIIQANNAIKSWYKQYAHDNGIENISLIDFMTVNVPVNLIEKLQIEVATLIKNDIKNQKPSTQRSGAPSKAIISRWKTKEGRIRGNLMGKRVDFCARAVISPDPMIDVNEVGVPYEIAMRLTYPERVTPFNINKLQARIIKGKKHIEGAKAIVDKEGKMIYLDDDIQSKSIKLQLGDIVHRYLQDGDIAVLNRQPSLHRGSMMGHIVKLMPGRTLRLSLPCTPTYNADFDGDEMNLHIPQSEQARADILAIMSVPYNIVSPQSNETSIALVQDSLVGCLFFTRKNVFLKRHQVMDLLVQKTYNVPFRDPDTNKKIQRIILPIPAVLRPEPLWTGKQILSLLLPTTFHYKKFVRDLEQGKIKTKLEINPNEEIDLDESMDYDERCIIIDSGEILSGSLCRKIIGTGTSNIIQSLFDEIGPWATCNFLSDAQRVVNLWLSWRGFSVGMKDCKIAPEITEKIKKVFDRASERVKVIYKFARQMNENPPTNDNENNNNTSNDTQNRVKDKHFGKLILPASELEAYVSSLANEVLNYSGAIMKKHMTIDTNAIYAMHWAGSKGNLINCTQIAGMVGQTNVEGKRPQSESETRTLPCFKHNESIPLLENNAFINTCYEKGLNIVQLFFHTMGGREGLVDTSIKTADSGYIQRKLTKAEESAQITHNGLIKNSSGEIIEFAYGNDGLDAKYIKQVHCEALMLGDDKLKSRCLWNCSQLSSAQKLIMEKEIPKILELRDITRKAKNLPFEFNFENTLYVPVNVSALLYQKLKTPCKPNAKGCILLDDYLNELDKLCDEIDNFGYINKKISNWKFRSTTAFRLHIRYELRSKIVIKKHNMLWSTWENIKEKILNTFQCCIAQVGEMVGALAAQSIGEPSTQMTLNSVDYKETIVVKDLDKNVNFTVHIGEWIDNLLETSKILSSSNDTFYLPMNKNFTIQSVNEQGEISWKKIEAVTKHPIVNKDGSQVLIKVTTKSGKTVTATKAKSFLLRRNNILEQVEGEILKVGDFLPISKFDHFGSLQNLCDLEKNYIPGIKTKLVSGTLLDGEILYWINLGKKFSNNIYNESDISILEKSLKQDVYYDEIVSIEQVEPHCKYAYDLTVEETRNFCMENGICMADTFHFAGVGSKNVTLGIPRLKELVGATENIKKPSATIFLKKPFKNSLNGVKVVQRGLEYLNFGMMVQSCDNVLELPVIEHNSLSDIKTDTEDDEAKWVQYFSYALDERNTLAHISKYTIRYKLNKQFMVSKGLTPNDLATKLREFAGHKGIIAVSEFNMNNWILTVRILGMKPMVDKLIEGKISGYDDVEKFILTQVQTKLLSVRIAGIDGIKNTVPREIKVTKFPLDTNECIRQTEYILDTEGTCLLKLLGHPCINSKKTFSNDIHEVAQVLGIQAAANMLYHEFKNVIGFDGTYVNDRHFMRVVRTMTYKGYLLANSRHGFDSVGTSYLVKSSFEKPVEVLFGAALNAEYNPVGERCITENIILGQLVPMGSAVSDVLVDEKYLNTKWKPNLKKVANSSVSTQIVYPIPPKPPAILDDDTLQTERIDYGNIIFTMDDEDDTPIPQKFESGQIMKPNIEEHMPPFQPPPPFSLKRKANTFSYYVPASPSDMELSESDTEQEEQEQEYQQSEKQEKIDQQNDSETFLPSEYLPPIYKSCESFPKDSGVSKQSPMKSDILKFFSPTKGESSQKISPHKKQKIDEKGLDFDLLKKLSEAFKN